MGNIVEGKGELKAERTASKDYTMEDLENIVRELSKQNQTMRRQINSFNESTMLKRLEFLLRIVDNQIIQTKEPKFVLDCIKEIIDTMTIPKEEEDQNETGKQ